MGTTLQRRTEGEKTGSVQRHSEHQPSAKKLRNLLPVIARIPHVTNLDGGATTTSRHHLNSEQQSDSAGNDAHAVGHNWGQRKTYLRGKFVPKSEWANLGWHAIIATALLGFFVLAYLFVGGGPGTSIEPTTTEAQDHFADTESKPLIQHGGASVPEDLVSGRALVPDQRKPESPAGDRVAQVVPRIPRYHVPSRSQDVAQEKQTARTETAEGHAPPARKQQAIQQTALAEPSRRDVIAKTNQPATKIFSEPSEIAPAKTTIYPRTDPTTYIYPDSSRPTTVGGIRPESGTPTAGGERLPSMVTLQGIAPPPPGERSRR